MTPRQYWGPKRGLMLNVKIHVSREVIFVSSQEHYNITVCYYTLQAFSDIEITEYIVNAVALGPILGPQGAQS